MQALGDAELTLNGFDFNANPENILLLLNGSSWFFPGGLLGGIQDIEEGFAD